MPGDVGDPGPPGPPGLDVNSLINALIVECWLNMFIDNIGKARLARTTRIFWKERPKSKLLNS